MNKSSFIESRFFTFMDISFGLVKASLLFWGYMARGFFVFNLTSSLCTLLEVVDELFTGSGKSVRKLFQELQQKYGSYKKLSVSSLAVILYLMAFIFLPYPRFINSFYSSILLFACIYALLLVTVYYCYVCWNLSMKNLSLKKSLMYGFYLMMKRFLRTLLLIGTLLAVFYLAQMNAIFLIFFAPGVYTMCIRFILRKM